MKLEFSIPIGIREDTYYVPKMIAKVQPIAAGLGFLKADPSTLSLENQEKDKPRGLFS